MPLQLISEFAVATVELLWIALVTAVPAFALVLVGQAVFKKVNEKFKLGWIQAALLATFAVMLPIVFVFYLVPYYIAFSGTAQQTAPEFLQITGVEYVVAFFFTIVKNLASTAIFAVLLMPWLFLASFASEKLKERFNLQGHPNTFASVFLTSLAAWIVVLFVFPWLVGGLFYLLYWGTI